MKVLRKPSKLKPFQVGPKPAHDPYTLLTRVWLIAVVSLVIDPLLTLISPPGLPAELFMRGSIAMALATLPFLDRSRTSRLLSYLRRTSKHEAERSSFFITALLVASVIATLATKTLLMPRIDNVMALCMVIVLAIGATKHIAQTIRARKKQRERFKTAPHESIQNWEYQLVTFTAVPIVMARSISALASLGSGDTFHSGIQLLSWITSALFLGMLKPDRTLVMGHCPRCRHPARIVYVEYGSCPQCDEKLRKDNA